MQNETTVSTPTPTPTWLYTASVAVLAAWFVSGLALAASILG